MLCVVNAFDAIHTGTAHGEYPQSNELYVLDTEDLLIEPVSRVKLLNYMEDGLILSNVELKGKRLYLKYIYPLWEIMMTKGINSIACLNGMVHVHSDNSIAWLNGAVLRFSYRTVRNKLCVMLGEQLLCKYDIECGGIYSGISHLYRLNGYFVVRELANSAVQGLIPEILTTVILDENGAVVGVVPSRKFTTLKVHPVRDELFMTKFLSIAEGRY